MAVLVKNLNGLAFASVKSRNGLAVASAKSINGLDTTAGGGFVPTDIAGCVLWLRASSLSLSNGDPISTWEDESGNGNDMTSSGSDRPTFLTGPTVNFNGSQWFDHSLNSGVVSLFVRLKPSITSGGTAYRSIFTNSEISLYTNVNTDYWGTYLPGYSGTILASGVSYVLAMIGIDDGVFYTDGESDGTYDNGTGQLNRIGGWVGIGQGYNGTLDEVVAYDSAISGGDLADVFTYLGV